MAEQYWVGDFYIDLSRNQITQKMESQTIPPKALAVLTYLAKHANRVVSQDELLSEIWPNTVVTPNTLQRSIAQLRKALGDDGQYQTFIKTHAKKGYSLECEVRWEDNVTAQTQQVLDKLAERKLSSLESDPDNSIETGSINSQSVNTQSVNSQESQNEKSLPTRKLGLGHVIVGMIAISIGIYVSQFIESDQNKKIAFSEMRALTSTNLTENSAVYSPDGQFVVFKRYPPGSCASHLFAKNMNTFEEIQLTKETGTFGTHSFSKNGDELVLIEEEDCTKPVTQKQCYKLSTINFNQALKEPIAPQVEMECKNSRIIQPKWMNNDEVAMLQQFTNRWKLVSYSMEDKLTRVIHEVANGNVLDYDYSNKKDILSTVSYFEDDKKYIEIIEPSGKLLSSHPIEYLQEVTDQRNIYPNFMNDGEQLIFSTGRQLFTLSFEGKMANISLPLDQPMWSLIFSPNGKKMLVTKGIYDSDVVRVPLARFMDDQKGTMKNPLDQDLDLNKEYKGIARTNLEENFAMLQPNGQRIAFMSARTGDDQLWVADGSRTTQLTNFAMDTFILGMDWAMDGQSILVNSNKSLYNVSLDGTVTDIAFPHPIQNLFYWNSQQNTALANIELNGLTKFVELDLNSKISNLIVDGRANWALKTESGKIIYTDHMDRFWQSGPAEFELIEKLSKQGSYRHYVSSGENLIGISDDYQLWSYNLATDQFQILAQFSSNVDNITDMNENEIFFTTRINSRKEVAELVLAD